MINLQQDVEPEPQPLLAGLRQQGDQAAGAPASILAESEVRAGLGLRPGPPPSAPGTSSLCALRAQLPGHDEGPAAVEQVAGQESERRQIPAAFQVPLADEIEWWRRRGRG